MGNDEVMKKMENMRDSKTLINFLAADYNVCKSLEMSFNLLMISLF